MITIKFSNSQRDEGTTEIVAVPQNNINVSSKIIHLASYQMQSSIKQTYKIGIDSGGAEEKT